ncbi:DUF4405 domain-containing protein [Paenibacillus sp. FSL R7-0216]|uniref:DUF4405 domain-containing protein n=1 Tax=Paenibacillus sp. FSL R7-0216 TaxID=2921677 RepID=UPI0030DAB175
MQERQTPPRDRKKKEIMYVKFGLDLLMALTFVLFFNKQVLGGLPFHEIAGVAMGGAILTHILLNWRWVAKITMKLFDRKLPLKTRFSYVLNLLLLASMGFVIISGIFISRVVFPNIHLGNESWFKLTHMSVSYLVLILVAIHIGLHWKWAVGVFHQIIHYRMKKPRLGVLAKVAVALLLVFGVYQMYATNFVGHVQSISNVLGLKSMTAHAGDFGDRERGQMDADGDFDRESGERPQWPDGDEGGSREGLDHSGKPSGGLRGEGRGIGSVGSGPNVFGVIAEYLGIIAVMVIAVYYLEKWLMRRKAFRKLPVRNE